MYKNRLSLLTICLIFVVCPTVYAEELYNARKSIENAGIGVVRETPLETVVVVTSEPKETVTNCYKNENRDNKNEPEYTCVTKEK